MFRRIWAWIWGDDSPAKRQGREYFASLQRKGSFRARCADPSDPMNTWAGTLNLQLGNGVEGITVFRLQHIPTKETLARLVRQNNGQVVIVTYQGISVIRCCDIIRADWQHYQRDSEA